MAATIKIEIVTTGGVDAVKKDLQGLSKTAEQSGGGFSAMREIATGALRAIGEAGIGLAVKGLQAVAGAISDGIADAKLNAQIQAQTAAVLKSTGNAAGVSAQHIAEYASSLSDAAGKSLFGDDQIQQSTNLLLTFTNIKGKALDAATAISVDMAQALGGAPKDAAIQLGKALNDPVKGITALTRVGVTFSDEQKAMIQAMTEAGDTAGAQQVILDELNKEFGGSAAAAAAATGGWSEFNGRMGEAKEALGAAVLPLLNSLAGVLNDSVLPVVEQAAAAFSAWLADPAVQANIQAVVTVIGTTLSTAFTDLTTTVIPALIAGWNAIQPALQVVGEFITNTVIPAIGELGGWLKNQIPGAIAIATTYWNTTLLPVFNALVGLWETSLQPALSDLIGWLKVNIPIALAVAANFWNTILQPAIAQVANIIATVVIPIIGDLINWLRVNIPIAITAAKQFIDETLIPAFNTIWTFLKNNVIPIIMDVVTWLRVNIPTAMAAVSNFITTTLIPAFNNIWAFIRDNVIPIIKTLIEDYIKVTTTVFRLLGEVITNIVVPAATAIGDYIDKTLSPVFRTIHDFIKDHVSPIMQTLADKLSGPLASGASTVKGIFDAVSAAIHAIGDAIRDVLGWIQKMIDKLDSVHVPSILQQSSPSILERSLLDVGHAAVFASGGVQQMHGTLRNTTSTVINNNALTFAPSYGASPSQQIDYQFAKSLAGVI